VNETTVTGAPITRRPAIGLDRAPREWLLSFVAGCSVVLEAQVARLLTVRADAPPELVTQLRAEGLVADAPRLRGQRGAHRITAEGLRLIGSHLPVPRIDLREYWRDVGAGWLAVDARRGIFGPEIERLYTRREMVAADRRIADATPAVDPLWSDAVRAKAADASFAVQAMGFGGVEGRVAHYPDLTVVIAQGRVAMELCPVVPSRARLEEIIDAYARKPQLVRTMLIVPNAAMLTSIAKVVERCGASERVVVQQVRLALR
jgi:hypothetical protein